MTRVVRVHPARPVQCAGYDLDAFVVECQDDGGGLDVRFELGRELGIYWALAAGPGDRLRLIEVDGAAYTVDEPILHADPFVFDLAEQSWRGELGALPAGMVVAVTVAARREPPSYRCEVTLRDPAGTVRTHAFTWSGPPSAP